MGLKMWMRGFLKGGENISTEPDLHARSISKIGINYISADLSERRARIGVTGSCPLVAQE
jgi:hypothetical protein